MNSKEVEWGDLKIWMNGVFITKAIEAQYEPTQEKEPLYGAGNEAYSIQRGNRSYRGTVVFHKNAVDMINRAVQLAGGKDLLDADFTLVFEYKPTLTRPLQMDTLIGLEFTSAARSIIQNQKSMPVRLPFIALNMIST